MVNLRTCLGVLGLGILSTGWLLSEVEHREELNRLENASKCPQVERKVTPRTITKVERKILYRGINKAQLEGVIEKVLTFLEVKDVRDWTKLLLLTAMTESDCGVYLKQVRGPAKGIFQNEPETEKDCLRWTKQKYPKLYVKIKQLRVPAKIAGLHEGEYNIAYSVAMAYMEYLHRKVDPRGKNLKELAKLHKIYYNTILGKGTINNTMNKAFDVHSPWLLTEK